VVETVGFVVGISTISIIPSHIRVLPVWMVIIHIAILSDDVKIGVFERAIVDSPMM